jgi:chromosome segregation ATPase
MEPNTQFCAKISESEYKQQSSNYTMAQLKELREQMLNFDMKKSPKQIDIDDEDSEDSEDNLEDEINNSDSECEEGSGNKTNVIINIKKQIKRNKNSIQKYSPKEKEIIILELFKKFEQNEKRIRRYSNRIKDLKKEMYSTESKLHYLKLDMNNLTIHNESLNSELKEKNNKIKLYSDYHYKTQIQLFVLKFIIICSILINFYQYFL